MREALEIAWKRGFLPGSKNPADYRIGGMNMGWELPGSFEVEMHVRELSLKVVPRVNPKGSRPGCKPVVGRLRLVRSLLHHPLGKPLLSSEFGTPLTAVSNHSRWIAPICLRGFPYQRPGNYEEAAL